MHQSSSARASPFQTAHEPRLALCVDEFNRRWAALGVADDKDRAGRMGVAKSTYSATKSGQREPNSEFVARACLALNASPSDLFTVTGELES